MSSPFDSPEPQGPYLPPAVPKPPTAPPFAQEPLPTAPPVWGAAAPSPPPGKGKGWLWAVLACAAIASVVVVVVFNAAESEPQPRLTPTVSAPTDGVDHFGDSGWVMSLGPEWQPFEMDSFTNEGVWATGAGTETFGHNVNVFVESPPGDMTLDTYMEFSESNSEAVISGVVVVGNEIFDSGDHDYGRLEYSAAMEGIRLHFLAIVVKVDGSFAVATYTATSDLFAREVGSVEPYLTTLRAA